MNNPILIATAAATTAAANACIEEMRAALPWAEDFDIGQVVAPGSVHTAEDATNWWQRSKERESELRAASMAAREVFSRRESEFTDATNPLNRVVVGVECGVMGGQPHQVRLYEIRRKLFSAAIQSFLRKDDDLAKRYFARVMQEFVGAADFALTHHH